MNNAPKSNRSLLKSHPLQQLAKRALGALLVLGLTACAGELASTEVPGQGAVVPAVSNFTGDYINGQPLYRLPSVTVTASRSTEMAKMAAEEKRQDAEMRSSMATTALTPGLATIVLSVRRD
jgi:hypothetical protein